jgi:hypothetical protein
MVRLQKEVLNMHRLKKMLVEQMDYESTLLERFEKEMQIMPEGSLCLKKVKGNSYIYYQNKKLSENRLLSPKKKEDSDLIGKIRKKFFIKKSIYQLRENRKIAEVMLRNFNPFDPEVIRNQLGSVYKEVQIIEWKSFMELELEKWKENKNENFLHPEGLKHISAKGQRVRSKSETIIADLLDYKNIIYKYEEPLNLNGQNFLPDFTILRSFDSRTVYWEHFGMIYDLEYRKNMEAKLLAYGNSGIIPWDNLIITFDSEEGSIDVSIISAVIDNMLLLK